MISPHCQLHQVRVRFVMPSYLPSPWKAFCRAQVCVLDSAQHTVEMGNHLLNHHKSCCHHSNHHLGKTVLGSVRTSIVSVIHDFVHHFCRWHGPKGIDSVSWPYVTVVRNRIALQLLDTLHVSPSLTIQLSSGIIYVYMSIGIGMTLMIASGSANASNDMV